MNAVSYPDPLAEPRTEVPIRSTVTPLSESAASRSRLVGWALGVLAIVAGAAAAVVWWPEPAPVTTVHTDAVAEQVVVAHLHGDVATLERLVAIELGTTVEPGRFYVRAAWAVETRQLADGQAVTVAADVLEAVDGGFALPRIEYHEVVFAERPTGPIVVGLPGLITAPDAGPVRATRPAPPPDDAVTAAVRQYLENGPLAGFDRVDFVGMARTAADDFTVVLVEVMANRAGEQPIVMQYSLDVRASESGWQVSRRGS